MDPLPHLCELWAACQGDMLLEQPTNIRANIVITMAFLMNL